MQRNNIKVVFQRNLPKQKFKCEMCGSYAFTKPYHLEFISFVGTENTKMSTCRKCSYKEMFGSKNIGKAMKEKLIEEETN